MAELSIKRREIKVEVVDEVLIDEYDRICTDSVRVYRSTASWNDKLKHVGVQWMPKGELSVMNAVYLEPQEFLDWVEKLKVMAVSVAGEMNDG